MFYRETPCERGQAATFSAPTCGRSDTQRTPSLFRTMLDLGLVPAVLCTGLSVSLIVARWSYTGQPAYLFLVWNLFLAWVPWVCAVPLAAIPSRAMHRWKLLPLFCTWLAFLPNAPYLVTDLLHLRPRAGVPLWFDAALLFVFAWTGCLLGFLSLTAVHGRLEAWLGRTVGWLFVAGVSLLSGFGIYLGRFPRWNSWDIITRPEQLLSDVMARLLNPTGHPRTMVVTLLFATLMIAGYTAFARMRCGPLTRSQLP